MAKSEKLADINKISGEFAYEFFSRLRYIAGREEIKKEGKEKLKIKKIETEKTKETTKLPFIRPLVKQLPD